jgi:hypothetical protein
MERYVYAVLNAAPLIASAVRVDSADTASPAHGPRTPESGVLPSSNPRQLGQLCCRPRPTRVPAAPLTSRRSTRSIVPTVARLGGDAAHRVKGSWGSTTVDEAARGEDDRSRSRSGDATQANTRIMSDDPTMLGEVGAHLGLRDRTRQLEVRAKQCLRRELRALATEIEWPSEEPAVDGGRDPI